jgi:hypothetical protein
VIFLSQVKTDCRFKFREAALIDNVDSNDFAYPFCDCTIGTFKKYRDQVYRYAFKNIIFHPNIVKLDILKIEIDLRAIELLLM